MSVLEAKKKPFSNLIVRLRWPLTFDAINRSSHKCEGILNFLFYFRLSHVCFSGKRKKCDENETENFIDEFSLSPCVFCCFAASTKTNKNNVLIKLIEMFFLLQLRHTKLVKMWINLSEKDRATAAGNNLKKLQLSSLLRKNPTRACFNWYNSSRFA